MNIPRVISLLPAAARRHAVVKALLRLSPGSFAQEIEFNGGARAVVDLRDPNPRNYFLTRSFEPEFFAIAAPFLAAGGTFLDGGANFGLCSLGLLAELPDAALRFHLFEANPLLIPFLEKSRALHPGADITINHGCLADAPGVSRLRIARGDFGQSHVDGSGTTEAPNVVLDDYCEAHSVPEVTFLKLDIEGWEPVALRGLERTTARGLVHAIYTEFAPDNLRRARFEPAELTGWLTAHGFDVFLCKPEDEGRAGALRWFDARVNGRGLRLARMNGFLPGFQTDLLAVHRAGRFFEMITPSATEVRA